MSFAGDWIWEKRSVFTGIRGLSVGAMTDSSPADLHASKDWANAKIEAFARAGRREKGLAAISR